MPYDPTLYAGAAHHYVLGRPPYSGELADALGMCVALDGSGRLLDVGCGPGKVALQLSAGFREALGLDPDADMLSEAAHEATRLGITNCRWVKGLAEDLPILDLGRFRLVTFAASFHWVDDQTATAEAVYDLLEDGGALALISNRVEDRPKPAGPGEPEIPHDRIMELIRSYLGPKRRTGQGVAAFQAPDRPRWPEVLQTTRFGSPTVVYARGQPDVVRTTDSVISGYFSMSFAAPHLFGDRIDDFERDVRTLLDEQSPTGRFWDWPGDTEIIVGLKVRA